MNSYPKLGIGLRVVIFTLVSLAAHAADRGFTPAHVASCCQLQFDAFPPRCLSCAEAVPRGTALLQTSHSRDVANKTFVTSDDTDQMLADPITSQLPSNADQYIAIEEGTLPRSQGRNEELLMVGKADLVDIGDDTAEQRLIEKVSESKRKWIVAIVGALLLAAGGALYMCFRSRAWKRSEPDQAADRVAHRASVQSMPVVEEDAGDWHPLRHFDSALQNVGLLTDDSADLLDSHGNEMDNRARIKRYVEKQFTSFKLLIWIVGALAQVWGMLGLMYYTLLMNEGDLMDCFGDDEKGEIKHGIFVRHLCSYTQACLRGFPIMSVNLTTVLMIRILIQMRIYYSLLREGYVLDFADTNVMTTQWPWMCALSMAQGGIHLVLKMLTEQNVMLLSVHLEIARRFLVPGCIFLSFFMRYVEIEGALVPLNRIIERDYSKDDRNFRTLGDMKAIYERVACWDARHRDVVGEVTDQLGRPPPLSAVMENLITNYDSAAEDFYGAKTHFEWGFFRSLWPAALLVDHRRLDWNDRDTRHWLIVVTMILVGSLFTSFVSLCFFVSATYRNISIAFLADKDIKHHGFVSETMLANAVLLAHALIVLYFLHCAYHGMFHFEIKSTKEVPTEQL